MSSETTNPAWELRLWQQRTGEWIERTIAGLQLPNAQPPNQQVDPIGLPIINWEIVFWLMIVGLIAWSIWMVYPLLTQYLARRSPEFRRPRPMPPQPIRTSSDWLKAAKAARQQGEYTQACRALYFAMITRLQDQDQLPSDPSLTNGDYRIRLNQLRQNSSQNQSYRTLINAHDRGTYSDQPLTAQQYEDCDRAFGEIEAEK